MRTWRFVCIFIRTAVILPFFLSPAFTSSAIRSAPLLTADLNPNPPGQTVRLIFIHHSTGENWLSDSNGALGIALRDNNYLVSDTNYGWGTSCPECNGCDNGTIGSCTDLGHWYYWFRGPRASTYLSALYAETGQNCEYSRLASSPVGENKVILFKSCFPNSALQGNSSDPIPAIGSNPLRGNDAYSENHTVANAKGIYQDLRNYFQSRPDKLFIVLTAPPLSDPTYAANARAFNNWLVYEWLSGYPANNLAVFDFYNVLTTNGGSPSINDVASTSGNHHRYYQGAIQHKNNAGSNTLVYPSGDDHPSQAGNRKATVEFLSLLNIYYHRWADGVSPSTTLTPTTTSTSSSSSTSRLNSSTTSTSTSSSSTRRTTSTTTSTTSSTTTSTTSSTSSLIQTTTTLKNASLRYFPHMLHQESASTGVAVVNSSDSAEEVVFRLYADSGDFLGSTQRTLPPRHQMAELISQLFPSLTRISAWLSMESRLQETDGFFLNFTNALTRMDGSLSMDYSLRDFVLAVADDVEMILVNPSDRPVTYTLAHVLEDGGGASDKSGTIPAKGRQRISSEDMGIHGVKGGYFHGSADGGLCVMETFGNDSRLSALPAADASIPGWDQPMDLYAAQYAAGGGWSSSLYLVNLEDHTLTLTLSLRGDNGGRIGNTGMVILPQRGATRIDNTTLFAISNSTLTQGYISIHSENGRFTGAVCFSDTHPGRIASALPLLSGGSQWVRFHHLAQDATYYTGLAAVNPSDQSTEAHLTVFNPQGNIVGTATRTIAAYGRFSRLLSELIPDIAPITGGYLELQAVQPLVSFALFGTHNGSVLSAIPAQAAIQKSPLCQYADTFRFSEVPQPLQGDNPLLTTLSENIPYEGKCYPDGRYQTILRKATRIDGIRGRHEYSRFDPFNQDQSMVILLGDPFSVYRTVNFPWNQPSNWICSLSMEEPRWDRQDRNLLWGLNGFRIVTFHVPTQSIRIIKDFAADPVIGPLIARGGTYRITTKDEGESSWDNRYWALFLQGDESKEYAPTHGFTWDRLTDTVPGIAAISPQEKELDWIGMSPLGGYVLIGGMDNNGGRFQGLTLADRALSRFHRLDYTTAHSDVGLDSSGQEVIVMQNVRTDYIDLIPLDWSTLPILDTGTPYAGTGRVPLLRLFYSNDSPYGLNAGIHLSCNTPGYCLVSPSLGPGFQERNWLDRTQVLVSLNRSRPRVFHLAKVHNVQNAYFEETHGSISNDGKMIVWADNWGQNVGQEKVFLIQLLMPENWRTLLSSAYTAEGWE